MQLQYKHIVAVIYTIALFLDRLDLTIVNVILPTLAEQFDVPITSINVISTSFLTALAISIPISNWIGERIGLKTSYLIAVMLFGFGISMCAFANSLQTIIILRFIQGLGSGMLIPLGMTMLYRTYDKSEYASITSFTFLPSLIAPAIAPFLGGILLDFFGWRVVFLFSGPICFILFILILFLIKKDGYRSSKKFDFGGFILAFVLLLDIFYTLSVISSDGISNEVIYGIIIAIICIMLFISWEAKQTYPLIDLSFFKSDNFIKANLLQLCFQICHFGAIFLVGMYLQVGIKMSASTAGLIMGMQAIGAMVISRYSVGLFNRYGAKIPITIGLIGVGILSPCILLLKTPDMIIFGSLLFLIRGIFSGLCGTPIQTLSVVDFSKEEIGQVNSVFNACRQISISSGIACSSIFLSIGFQDREFSNKTITDINQAILIFTPGFTWISAVAIIGVLISYSLKSIRYSLHVTNSKKNPLTKKNRKIASERAIN